VRFQRRSQRRSCCEDKEVSLFFLQVLYKTATSTLSVKKITSEFGNRVVLQASLRNFVVMFV
jgi:hypothetical protein